MAGDDAWDLGDPERYLETYWSRFPGVWAHGDWASVDDDGYWFLHGRSDDTLNIAGKRIGPAELEAPALGCAGVVEAAAIGMPHDVKGEVPWLFVVAETGAEVSVGEIDGAIVAALGKPFRPRTDRGRAWPPPNPQREDRPARDQSRGSRRRPR